MAESAPKKQKTGSQLEQLASMTTVVADTAAVLPEYQALVDDAISFGKAAEGVSDEERLALIIDKMSVNFGLEILKIVPGYVSTEVDARLSFNKEANVMRAKRIISMYEKAGVSRDRILIKIASTWEGIEAAKELKKDNIKCNMTLLFNFAQAVAAAQAGVQLISPFVGRILDWYKKANNVDGYPAHEDPGVLSVTKIYNYYKKYGYDTIVMGASFRNKDELLALAGCDRLTIAPKFLEVLKNCDDPVAESLSAANAANADVGPKLELDENAFRWMLNEDAMATEKLAEGIRNFAKDLVKPA